jgi:uncharacterized protein (DUF2225 family)
MITPKSECPLCKRRFDREALHSHITVERKEIQDYTIRVIKAMNPKWVSEDGSCPRCWKFYRALGRIVKPIMRARKDEEIAA